MENDTTSSQPLRALSLGELLDLTVKIYRAHWRTLVIAVLVVVVPLQIAGTVLTADYTLSGFTFDATSTTTIENSLDELDKYLGGLVLAGLLQVVAVAVATAACLRAVMQAYVGVAPDWRESVRHTLRRAPSLLLVALLYGLVVVAGMLLFVVPGIWLGVALAFALPALIVERLRGRLALRRSFELVGGRWWRTFGTLVLGIVLIAIVSAVVEAIFSVGADAADGNDALVLTLSTLSGIGGLVVSTPLQAALVAVVYVDLRVRKEGLDLGRLAGEIGADADAAPPSDTPPLAPLGGTTSPRPSSDGAGERGSGAPLWPSPAPPPSAGSAGEPGSAPASSGPVVSPPPPGWQVPSDNGQARVDDDAPSPESSPG